MSENQVQLDERQKSINRILEGFKGKYIKFCRQILLEIEKSASLSWNYQTLELIINDQTILHSNIQLLLIKLLEQQSPTLPFGLYKFVQALIDIQLPRVYFKGSDVQNIRSFLLKLSEKNIVKNQGNNGEPSGSGTQIVGDQGGEPKKSVAKEKINFLKRKRNVDDEEVEEDEEEEGNRKRARGEEEPDLGGVGNQNTSENIRTAGSRKRQGDAEFYDEEPRRSKRVQLKRSLGTVWDGLYAE